MRGADPMDATIKRAGAPAASDGSVPAVGERAASHDSVRAGEPAGSDGQPVAGGRLARTATGWTLALVSAALFMVTLDNLVVTTALPSIRVDLGASISDLEWTVNA